MKPKRRGRAPFFAVHRWPGSVVVAMLIHFIACGAAAAQPGAGTALDLDGLNDYIDTGIVWNMAADPITVEMWVYLPAAAGGTIFGQDGKLGSTWTNFFLSRGTDEVQFWTHGGGGHVATFEDPPTDRWTHLVLQVRDAGPFLKRIYFDLVPGTDGLREGLVADYFSFLIGGRNHNSAPSDLAQMRVDEVRIWDRIVSEPELREKMHRRLDPSEETGLVAYYRFDDAGGATADDAAGANDGAIAGSPVWLSPSTAPIGDHSHVGTGNSALSENVEVAVDLSWDDDPGTSALFAAIQVNDQPYVTSGLAGTIPSTYWELWIANDDGSFQADATFHFDGLLGATSESGLRLFTRPDAGAEWTDVMNSTLNDEGNPADGIGSITAHDLTAFSQFMITSSPSNQLPMADAGSDQVINCSSASGVPVNLDGTGSFDPDDDPLSYVWTGPFPEEGGTVIGSAATVTLAPGVHTITLVVDDGNGGTDDDDVTITVNADGTAPVIAIRHESIQIWPPNHKFHTIVAAANVAGVVDDCDAGLSATDVFVTTVASDEIENGRGDGDTVEDIAFGVNCSSVDVRAERRGGGNGRVYTIHLAASDAAGNVGTAAFSVHVPGDRKGGAFDDGVAYAAACTVPPPLTAARASTTDPVSDEARNRSSASSEELRTRSPSIVDTPGEVELHQNYPNPFNPQTELAFDIPDAAHVRLVVYDMLGREVARLVDDVRDPGRHEVAFDASRLSGGLYIAALTAGTHRRLRAMLLTK